MSEDDDIAAFIREHLPVVPVPGVPELRLHKAGPASGVGRLGDAAPYWAYWWGGGLALARYVLDHPAQLVGRRVLDLGAGSGLLGIAAARAGAARVTASEIDPHARAAIALNAALNQVTLAEIVGDLTAGPTPEAELLLVGDVFYAPEVAVRVTAFLDRCVAAGITVLVGDPWRSPLPIERLTLLARYDVAETGVARPAGVFAYRAG
ncbi:methyltransferase [Sphingomonas sp. ABOLD]|uniref:Putative nicotinamide N-methyase n=1 Tax=Sphingomonas trueperi TaxID=53317 RepID=A0A7X6BC18_9SPHN|nr:MULTISPECIES: 50S ribosomal protein L11 methyltransferase [unclassified Sphingomonas]NJB96780.1 putative nicotinamide N-methyase [Sphingomonas trueperi]RSV44352.1 methyltransferase [Sphingomonas sp. ABOLE]RSV51940.1 methyltransferase [Sphingomonas sp. ABOLD]